MISPLVQFIFNITKCMHIDYEMKIFKNKKIRLFQMKNKNLLIQSTVRLMLLRK